MSAGISRTALVLLCAVAVFLLPLGGYRQAFLPGEPGTSQPDAGDEAASDPGSLEEQDEGLDQEPDEIDQPEPEPESEAESGPEPVPEIETEPEEENIIEPETEGEPKPEPREEITAYAYDLAAHERVVKTFAQLESALSENNGITAVYLGADITMESGIHIHNSKTNVVIDGIDPTNPDQAEPFTLTDRALSDIYQTIYVNSSGVKSVTVRDMKVIGRNFYGPVSIVELASITDSAVLVFERIDYNGPQIGHHRRGTIRFVDCHARIHGQNAGSIGEEFSEAKHLVFAGNNTIHSDISDYSVCWFPLGGSLTLEDDSSLTITSPFTSSSYGMFYTGGAAYKLNVSIGQRAVLNATISNYVSAIATVISSWTVGEGGEFNLTTTGSNGLAAVFPLSGNLTVEPDAVFRINANGGGTAAVLNTANGDITVGRDATFQIVSASTSSSLLNMNGNSFTVNDPVSVLFYNPDKRDIQATTTVGRITISADQINYWSAAAPESFNNPPRYHWQKADGSLFGISGTLSVGTGANWNVSGFTHNYAAGDSPPGTPPSTTAFSMAAARVLAFGRLELDVNTPIAGIDEITGITAPNASVRALFSQQGTDYVTATVNADENGVFMIPTGISLQPLTDVTVQSGYQYLTTERVVTVSDAGRVSLIAPGELYFYTAKLAPKTQTIQRQHANWGLLVSDTRGAGSAWRVFVRALVPLTPEGAQKPALTDALIFVDETGSARPLGPTEPQKVYERINATGDELVNISWSASRGVLVRVPTGAAYSGVFYSGVLEWELVDAV